MADNTGIQWTDATWNPVTGCTKVSPGCAHCYAETVADRFWATQYPHIKLMASVHGGYVTRPRRFTDVQCHPERLDQPLRWKKPRRVFVNSMSDLFHEDVQDEFIDQVFAVMALAPQHTFQVLTKRAERMASYINTVARRRCVSIQDTKKWRDHEAAERDKGVLWRDIAFPPWPLPNVWLGVSVENQAMVDERVWQLLRTAASIHFLSCEPLLQDLRLSKVQLSLLDWVIIGGESGPKARPCDVAWIRSIRDQCRAASVPCFVKQLGSRPLFPDEDCAIGNQPIHGKGGKTEEWPEDLRVREFPEVLA